MLSISSFNSASGFDVSSDAYQDLLQKKLDMAQKNADAVAGLSRRADMDQKDLARQRVKEIKEEIDSLRRMLLLFGTKDAKAVLQQLKQLASQLKQAANVLNTPSESSVPDVAATPAGQAATPSTDAETSDAYTEGRNAYAEQQASADAEAVQLPTPAPDAQGSEDKKQLEAAMQALKALRSMTERIVKQQQNQV